VTAEARLPWPPTDLDTRALPLEPVPRGTRWIRFYRAGKAPLRFGPQPGRPPTWRFDDPSGRYRVLYLGQSDAAAFAETFLRELRLPIIAKQDLAKYRRAMVELQSEVRLVRFYGPYLTPLGATAEVTHCPGSLYQLPRAWSRSLWGHPEQPDGILYTARHDETVLCIALFDRAAGALASNPVTGNLLDYPDVLGAVLRRYQVGLTE